MSGGPGTKNPERWSAENWSLNVFAELAYDLRSYQLSGPEWIRPQRYNITAKLPAGATKEQFRAMLQNLLAERFNMQVHHDTKEMPLFNSWLRRTVPGSTMPSPAYQRIRDRRHLGRTVHSTVKDFPRFRTVTNRQWH
jgi:uncharacterized protein (TIGR03435 family)